MRFRKTWNRKYEFAKKLEKTTMNRIDFFKNLLLGGTSLFVGKDLRITASKEVKNVYLNSPHIAGFQYYQGEEIEKELKENDTLTLKRETQNPHDYFAVEVFRNNAKLGYLPRSENKLIARMMDQGVSLKAQIRNIDKDAHPFRRVKVRVYSEMG